MTQSMTDMTALNALVERVKQDPALQQQFSTLSGPEDLVAQLAEHGIEIGVDELRELLGAEGLLVSDESVDPHAITDDDLQLVAGGVTSERNDKIDFPW